MTETKRFSLNEDTEWWSVQDNTIQVNKHGYRDDLTGEDEYRLLHQELTEQETVNLLNEFYEENKELKLQLEELKDKLCELRAPNVKRDDKRFDITVSNDNTVRLIDQKESNDLISIGFKKHSDAADCSDALQYLCNLMNGLEEENDVLRKQLETEYCSGHLEKSDFKDSQLIIDGNEVNCKIEELRASGYSDEYINKELGHLVNWRI